MGQTKFQEAVEKFEAAAVANSWKGQEEASARRAITLEYENAKNILLQFGTIGEKIRTSVFEEDWPVGMLVYRQWTRDWWRPGKIIGYTRARIRVELLDSPYGRFTTTRPDKLRPRTLDDALEDIHTVLLPVGNRTEE